MLLSNNQIDKLGERLKLGSPSDEDVTMLSTYRSSFFDAAKAVADTVREISGLEVTARSLKTTLSIVAKLKRDGVKQLSSMQDIGGCRVTVRNLTEQDELVEKLLKAYPDAKLYDRVAKPSHGYRAKHLVMKIEGRRIEIQVRTLLQHRWALLSEAGADAFGQNLKYGMLNEVGSFPTTQKNLLTFLMKFSDAIIKEEISNSDSDSDFLVLDETLQAIHIELEKFKTRLTELKD